MPFLRSCESFSLVKTFHTFYGKWMFITILAGTLDWYPICILQIQPALTHPVTSDNNLNIIFLFVPQSWKIPTSFKFSASNFKHISDFFMHTISIIHWSDHYNNVWQRADIMKFFIMQLPLARPFFSKRSNFSPQHRSQTSWVSFYILMLEFHFVKYV